MNIMPSSLLCKAARPSEATFMLSFEWLETARPLDALLAKELQPDIEGTEEPLFRAQNRSIGVQVGEIHDAVGADYV